jgi:hypothetical protein
MKGILHKTEQGWIVIYDEVIGENIVKKNQNSLPLLDNGHIDGLKLYDSNEGLEVEFEIVEFPVPPTNGPVSNSISIYAKLVDKATRPLTENDAWITMKEGDITVNFKPLPEFDEPAYPTRLVQLKEQAWDVIWKEFRDNKNASYAWSLFEHLRDNYNPPTKKQDNE